MMVTVLLPGGGRDVFAATGAVRRRLRGRAVIAGVLVAVARAVALGRGTACGCLVATTATGSPPSGSSREHRPAATTSAEQPEHARDQIAAARPAASAAFFFLSWPSGAFRSSGATATDPCESCG